MSVYLGRKWREGREIKERNRRILGRSGLGGGRRRGVGELEENGERVVWDGEGRGKRVATRKEKAYLWGAGRFYGSVGKVKEVVGRWVSGEMGRGGIPG